MYKRSLVALALLAATAHISAYFDVNTLEEVTTPATVNVTSRFALPTLPSLSIKQAVATSFEKARAAVSTQKDVLATGAKNMFAAAKQNGTAKLAAAVAYAQGNKTKTALGAAAVVGAGVAAYGLYKGIKWLNTTKTYKTKYHYHNYMENAPENCTKQETPWQHFLRCGSF